MNEPAVRRAGQPSSTEIDLADEEALAEASRELGLVRFSLAGLRRRRFLLDLLRQQGLVAYAATETVGRLENLRDARNALISVLREVVGDRDEKDIEAIKLSMDLAAAIARLAASETYATKVLVEMETELRAALRPVAARLIAPPGATMYVALQGPPGSAGAEKERNNGQTLDTKSHQETRRVAPPAGYPAGQEHTPVAAASRSEQGRDPGPAGATSADAEAIG